MLYNYLKVILRNFISDAEERIVQSNICNLK
jgi:hypothetical protein